MGNVGKRKRLLFNVRLPEQAHFQVNLTFVVELEKIPFDDVVLYVLPDGRKSLSLKSPEHRVLGDAAVDSTLVAWVGCAGRIAFQSILSFV